MSLPAPNTTTHFHCHLGSHVLSVHMSHILHKALTFMTYLLLFHPHSEEAFYIVPTTLPLPPINLFHEVCCMVWLCGIPWSSDHCRKQQQQNLYTQCPSFYQGQSIGFHWLPLVIGIAGHVVGNVQFVNINGCLFKELCFYRDWQLPLFCSSLVNPSIWKGVEVTLARACSV